MTVTDPSAGRPLLLPEKPFSEDDRRIVGDALRTVPTGRWSYNEIITAVLHALAAAGRLLPPDAERREEWNVRLPKPAGNWIVDDSMAKNWPPEPGEIAEDVAWWKVNAGLDVIPVKRFVAQFADGSWLTGPWVEVEGSTDA